MTSRKSKGQSRKLENITKKNKITFLLYMLEMPSHLIFNILKKNICKVLQIGTNI